MKLEIAPGQIADLYVLDGPSTPVQVTLLYAAGKRLLVQVSAGMARGTPVRIEWDPYVVLAEVWSCTAEGNVDLHVRHALHRHDIDYFEQTWKL